MKRTFLEFIGGYWDGKTLDGISGDPTEQDRFRTCQFLTHDFEIGRGFGGPSEFAQEYAQQHGGKAAAEVGFRWAHSYRIVERLEEGDEILVRFKYAPWGELPQDADLQNALKIRYERLLLAWQTADTDATRAEARNEIDRFLRDRVREMVGCLRWKERSGPNNKKCFVATENLARLDGFLWLFHEDPLKIEFEEGAVFVRSTKPECELGVGVFVLPTREPIDLVTWNIALAD